MDKEERKKLKQERAKILKEFESVLEDADEGWWRKAISMREQMHHIGWHKESQHMTRRLHEVKERKGRR